MPRSFSKIFLLIISFFFVRQYTYAQSANWQKIYHFGAIGTWAGSVMETSDQNLLVPMSYMTEDSSMIQFLVKINKNGDTFWSKKGDYGGYAVKRSYKLYSSIIDSSFIDKKTRNTINVYRMLEFNENGDILWKKDFYSDSAQILPYKILPFKDSSYIILGRVKTNPENPISPQSMLVQSFDKNHQILWSDTFSYDFYTQGSSIINTSDNKITICGTYTHNYGYNSDRAFLVYLSESGKPLKYTLFKQLPDSIDEINFEMKQLSNGDLVISSWAHQTDKYYLRKIDTSGKVIRFSEISGINMFGLEMETDKDSVYLFVGNSGIWGPMFLFKLDTEFIQTKYTMLGNNKYFNNGPHQIFKSSDGSLILSAYRSMEEGPQRWLDFLLFHFGKDFRWDQIPDSFSVVRTETPPWQITCGLVYPDPAGDIIQFNIGHPDPRNSLSLDIYDNHGHIIITWPHIEMSGNDKNISFLSPGLYFYRLYNDNQVYCTGKFVKE
jgi:hypothetical protein